MAVVVVTLSVIVLLGGCSEEGDLLCGVGELLVAEMRWDRALCLGRRCGLLRWRWGRGTARTCRTVKNACGIL